jgi:hypothetical protein
MRFEYIVLLIIAFNVITAVMQRRAKKARAEAQQRAAGGAAARGAAVRQSASKPFEVENDEGEDEEEWGGEYRDPYADRDSGPATTSRRPGSDAVTGVGASRPSGDEPMQMPSMGRDILDQLARDLGLKLPKPAPRPAQIEARPAPVDTAAATRSARESAHETVRAERVAEREMEREKLLASRTREIHGVERTVSGPALTKVKPVSSPVRIVPIDEAARSRTAPGSTPLRLNLSGPERLREAFVLKEILDLPVSRRRR